MMQNSSAFSTGVGVVKEAGLSQNLTEDKVPWAELKELATNNLEIIVSVGGATQILYKYINRCVLYKWWAGPYVEGQFKAIV